MKKTIYVAVLILGFFTAVSGTASAGTNDIEELKAELVKLKSVVEAQQRQLEQLSHKAADMAKSNVIAATNATPAVTTGWVNNKPGIRSADGSFEANLGGFVHFDYRGYESGTHPPNTFLVRRARLMVDGKVAKYFDYKIEGDFADTASSILRDGWLRVHRWEPIQFQFGQFKEPFSQEELRSDQVQDFVERSMVNNLAPARSPGLMVLGNFKKGWLEYQTGLFNGKGQLNANTSGTPDGVARIRFTPAKHSKNEWINGFSFGAAALLGRNGGNTTSGVRGQTESRSFTFYAADVVKGSYYRANGEMTWVKGPGAIRSEYVYSSQSRAGLGPAGTNLPAVEANAYMVQGTYLLTGEKKSDTGLVVPKHNLFGEGTQGGFGAWETKFRYSFLDINNHNGKANRASSFYFGANWYLNRFVKNVFDVGIEQYRDPALTPNPGDRTYFVFANRVQLSF
jgi:phosphate-selective porin OprO/OprP